MVHARGAELWGVSFDVDELLRFIRSAVGSSTFRGIKLVLAQITLPKKTDFSPLSFQFGRTELETEDILPTVPLDAFFSESFSKRIF